MLAASDSARGNGHKPGVLEAVRYLLADFGLLGGGTVEVSG